MEDICDRPKFEKYSMPLLNPLNHDTPTLKTNLIHHQKV